MPHIHITDLESAINYWREHEPSTDGVDLPSSTRALAEVYARMAVERVTLVEEASLSTQALAAWLQWYATTPDTPCIAICSTSQGDAVCKGCGRTFDEVQGWLGMGPAQKRAIWRRITAEGTALRFTRYAERAVG
jgi:predicted Fe-S protein YdhL (DUF1289 family)